MKSELRKVISKYYSKKIHPWEKFLLDHFDPVFDKAFRKFEQKALINDVLDGDEAYDICRLLNELKEHLDYFKPRWAEKYERSLKENYLRTLAEDYNDACRADPPRTQTRNATLFERLPTKIDVFQMTDIMHN